MLNSAHKTTYNCGFKSDDFAIKMVIYYNLWAHDRTTRCTWTYKSVRQVLDVSFLNCLLTSLPKLLKISEGCAQGNMVEQIICDFTISIPNFIELWMGLWSKEVIFQTVEERAVILSMVAPLWMKILPELTHVQDYYQWQTVAETLIHHSFLLHSRPVPILTENI